MKTVLEALAMGLVIGIIWTWASTVMNTLLEILDTLKRIEEK